MEIKKLTARVWSVWVVVFGCTRDSTLVYEFFLAFLLVFGVVVGSVYDPILTWCLYHAQWDACHLELGNAVLTNFVMAS